MLVEFHHLCRVGHVAVCQLGDVYKSVLVHPDVDEGTEIHYCPVKVD